MTYRERKKKRLRRRLHSRRARRRAELRALYKLNADVMTEIFRHFVATQKDGAFVLTLVSASWRDLVLQSPVLWSWISIDDHSLDILQKVHISSTLSRQCPLQIVIQLPLTLVELVITLIARCQNIFVEIPNQMNSSEVFEDTRPLYRAMQSLSCKIHWYRDGRELLAEPAPSREPLYTQMENVLVLSLDADGSEHPRYYYDRSKDKYSCWGEDWEGRRTEIFQDLDYYHPLILLPMYRVLGIMRNAPNLNTLVISHHSIDHTSSEVNLPVVTMMHLREMRVLNIDFVLNGNILALLESIKAPNLVSVTMSGRDMDVLKATTCLNSLGRPKLLQLYIDGSALNCMTLALQRSADIKVYQKYRSVPHYYTRNHNFITSVSIHIGENLGRVSFYRNSMVDSLAAFFTHHSGIAVINLTLPSNWVWHRMIWEVGCVHDEESSDGKAKVTSKRCSLRHLDAGNKFSFPESNCIQELDVRLPGLDQPSDVGWGTSFASLTTLKCTPFVLLPILYQCLLPRLHTIQLHWPELSPASPNVYNLQAEIHHFDAVITKWFIRHDAPFPSLRTLGISWFPEWKNLLSMLYSMARSRRHDEDMILKLPAYPDTSIQRAIAAAIGGEENWTEFNLPNPASFLKYHQSRLLYECCYYCRRSRLRCRLTQFRIHEVSHCDRYSQTDLVSLTKDTMVEVEEE